MAFTPVQGLAQQFLNDSNTLASGYYLKLYLAGTTTPYSMAVDSTGVQTLAKAKLSDEGYLITNPLDNTTVFIPHVDRDYKAVMYRTEADADADNTANAAWVVDNIAPDIANTATSADISMRGTTLQVQDDYDRSPLFVDGSDFTAGAGPHVITVPSEWTPSNSDMRFYKLAANGTVIVLTPTTTDATSFTIPDNLLSTDTLFIGDDVFRNQIDGDPSDIRARLGVITESESDVKYDARYLNESNNLSDLDSAPIARTNLDVYSKSESDGKYLDELNNLSDLDDDSTARTNLDVYSKSEVDNLGVTQISSTTSAGTWNITGVIVGRPLFIVADKAGQTNLEYRVISGAIGGGSISGFYFRMLSSNGSGGTGSSFITIPTATTVSIEIASAGPELYAYQ